MKSSPGSKRKEPAPTDGASTPKKKFEERDADPDQNQKGCTTSFLMQERGEMGGICDQEPNAREEYVQPDKEKEAGGEG